MTIELAADNDQQPTALIERAWPRFPASAPYAEGAKPKHPQFILALDYQAFKNVNAPWLDVANGGGYMLVPQPDELPGLFLSLQEHLVIRQRQWLDESKHVDATGRAYKGDRDYKQILPYCIFVYESTLMGGGDQVKVATYRRGSGAGEARLANNVSIGYGGHVDLADAQYANDSVLNLQFTVTRSMLRELNEEVRILNPEGQRVPAESLESEFNGFIVDGSNDVGQLHVAFVSFFMVPDHFRLEANEDELDTMQVDTVGNLLASDLPLESWTKIALENIVKRHVRCVPAEQMADNQPADNERFALAP